MKIAVTGKGGVGKTTLTALLARAAAAQGRRVFAIDADPNPNLAIALGFPSCPTPLLELKSLLQERLGALDSFFRLNPKVDDIPEEFAVEKDGIRLLVLGGVREGGAGCACPQNTLLKALLQHLILERHDWILVDFEAGLEHLGRATARGVDAMVVVLEADRAALETGLRIHRLAGEIGITRVYAVGNKLREPDEAVWLQSKLPAIEFLGFLPDSPDIRRGMRGTAPLSDRELLRPAADLVTRLETRRNPA
jgi:CO dehydrogenase maturation factor